MGAGAAERKLERGVTLRVETEALASALRARLGRRADVVVAETPEVDEAIESFEEYIDRQGAGRRREHDWVDDAPGATKAGFYEAAAPFQRVEPWRSASDGQVIAIDAPSLGWPEAIASVIGNVGEAFGLTLFRLRVDLPRTLPGLQLPPPGDQGVHGLLELDDLTHLLGERQALPRAPQLRLALTQPGLAPNEPGFRSAI